MPEYYPVYLNIRGRRCVVIGGGPVAERKVRGLLDSGGSVTVVSPKITEGVADLAREGAVQWVQRRYRDGDLRGAFLAIAGTDDTSVNREVAEEADREKALLNVVDVPPLCHFIAPAIVERGPVTVAITTSGTSPALARRLKEEMQRHDECQCLAWADAAGLLQEVRLDLRRRNLRAAPDHWQACMTDDVLELVRSGRHEAARERLTRALEAGALPTGATEA